MVTTAAGVDWTVVNTEVEALQLEYSWIKEYDPRFNVKYRDDKSYPWLAVTYGDEFPRVMVGRGAKRRGTRYYGPYSHAWAIRETVDLLLRVFPMRSCSNGVFKRSSQIGRPCLLGYIGKCSAPCVGRVTEQEHREIVDDFCDFMAGNTSAFVKRVERQMYDASAAAGLREGGPAARRPRRPQPGAGEAAGGARRRHQRRRARIVRGPARGRHAGVLRPQRPDQGPARLGGRPRRRLRHRRAGRRLPAPAVRRRVERRDPARDPGAGAARRRRDVRGAARRVARRQGVDPGAPARRQEGAPGDGRRQRQAVAGTAQDEAGERPHHAQPGAGGDPATPSAWRRRRCAWSATTSPTFRAPRWWRRWWCSRTAWPARASTAAS